MAVHPKSPGRLLSSKVVFLDQQADWETIMSKETTIQNQIFVEQETSLLAMVAR